MKTKFNLLTVDLEEWFVVEALSNLYTRKDWEEQKSSLKKNCRRLLNLFHRKGVQSTWFVLGWCAEKYPDLVAELADAGHEIACHSYHHQRVSEMNPDSFRKDTEKAVKAIMNATGIRPLGYRAPSWSINESVSWAFDILAELQFEYDSSIFPIKHDLYGMPSGPRQMLRMKLQNGQNLYEVPASTYRFLGQNLPVGGGGYLRHSPYWYTRWIIRKLNRQGQPAVVYIHPWEIDPDPPAVSGLSMKQHYRTYGSTDTLERKLERLLDDFSFTAMLDHVRYANRNKIGFER